MRILVVNGPNLNLLGKREVEVYGDSSLADIEKKLSATFPDVRFEFYQSNSEGGIIDHLQKAMGAAFDGVILNAAAYTHTSYAIRDTVAALTVPVIEVHLTNILAREEFRQHSVIGARCSGIVAGFGPQSYELAVRALLAMKS